MRPTALGETKNDELFSSILSGNAPKKLFVMPTQTFNEEKLTQYREALEKQFSITKEQFEITKAFVQPWYPKEDKQRRNKLGSLSLCQFKTETNE